MPLNPKMDETGIRARADKITAEIENLSDGIDAMDAANVILQTCDFLDIDPIAAFRNICGKGDAIHLNSGERFLRDLMETTQSNFENAIHWMLRILELDQEMSDLA